MKKTLCLIITLSSLIAVMAQRTQNIRQVNSAEIIQKGIQLHDKGQYKEALAEYAKIPFGDKHHDLALYETALTQESMGDYRNALQSITQLIDKPSCQVGRSRLFMILGNCYDYLEQYDKSIEAYDQGLQTAPYDYLLHFNKGVALFNNEKYEEAMECFKTSISISPSHQGSHYRYGLCCLNLGYTVPGILALNFATLINVSSNYSLRALQILETLYDSDIPTFNSNNSVDIDDDYEELNLFYKDIHTLLNSKAAVTQKFHNMSKINHDIVKYNQLVFSNVKVRPGSHALEDMLYTPYFQQIILNKDFNTLCYYQLSETDVDNNKVAKKAKKMKNEFHDLLVYTVRFINEKASHGLGRDNIDSISYEFSNQLLLTSWGKYNPQFKEQKLKEGLWTFINRQGEISEINHYKMDKQDGENKVYQDGELVQIAHWKNDQPDGLVQLYTADPIFHQSIPSEEFILSGNNYEGQYKAYHQNGKIKKEGQLIHSQIEGQVHTYDQQGHLSSTENYTNGEYHGPIKSYYPGGQLKTESIAGAKDEQTSFTEYYLDGTKKQEGFIINNQRVGEWTTYFPSGKIQTKEQYDNEGKTNGEGYLYLRDGKMYHKIQTEHGNYLEYIGFGTTTGTQNVKYEFQDGKLKAVKTYHTDGKIRNEYTVKNNAVSIDLYSDAGYKYRSGTLDGDFRWQGLLTDFYPNGQTNIEAQHKDDLKDGEYKTYYPNGKLQYHTWYKDGLTNGIYVNYYNNQENTIKNELYIENDTVKGAQYNYYPDGSLMFIQSNDQQGNITYQCSYRPDKSKRQEIKYMYGYPCYVINYNRSNEVIARDTLIHGNGFLNNYYPDGQLMSTTPLVGGLALGTSYRYNLSGQVIDSVTFLMGKSNGIVRQLFPTGSISSEGTALMGEEHGQYSYFLPNGHKYMDLFYEYGSCVSYTKYVLEDKKYSVNKSFNDDCGTVSFYAPDGKTLLYEILYEQDLDVQISCALANGKMSEPVIIGNEEQTFKAYYPNGAVGAVIQYKNGLINGVKSHYYPNGQACLTYSFVDDLSNGTFVTYYPNGNIYMKEDYKDNFNHGAHIMYYPNGNIMYEGNYYYDFPHGEFKTYDKEGKLTRRVVMYYGDAIEDIHY